MTLEEIRALRAAGRDDEYLAAATAYAAAHPDDPHARLEAGGANDYLGHEHEAIVHYEAALRLGVPPELRRRFLVWYGSTLRNVGRTVEAVAVLRGAVAEDSAFPAYHAFLALALLSAGEPREALAAMLHAALGAARPGAFEGFERALASYEAELRG